MNKIKVGFVGAGKRMRVLFHPLLQKFSSQYEITGFTCRTEKTQKEIEDVYKIEHFPSIETLTDAVDLVIVCVNPDSSESVVSRIINHNSHVYVLVETPVKSAALAQRLFQNKSQGLRVGVLEQWPYLPLEDFKNQLIAAGKIGKVIRAENDWRTFDYHGISQLRRYIGQNLEPVKTYGQCFFTNGSAGISEQWDHGIVTFADNVILEHKFSYNYKQSKLRSPQSLRAIGVEGCIYSACTFGKSDDYEIVIGSSSKAGGSLQKIEVNRKNNITREIVGLGERWQNHFDLDDHEYGVARHIWQIKRNLDGELNTGVLYPYFQGFLDYMIFESIRNSSDRQEPVYFR